jgi:hypothetical protein
LHLREPKTFACSTLTLEAQIGVSILCRGRRHPKLRRRTVPLDVSFQ